jgi:hypothetical protein
MNSLLLLNSNGQLFDAEAVERIIRTEERFQNVRFHEPGGALIEAKFVEGDDWTFVRLSGDRTRISLSGTSDLVLAAALILQERLEWPLRIVDTDYSFDLMLRDFPGLEVLQSAIRKAQAR